MSETFSRTFAIEETSTACDTLALLTGLPKARIKDCMTKGGVWWSRPGRATTRLRRATTPVNPGEALEINYDPHLLALVPASPELIATTRHYSVWNKPAGVLAQGTRFADHCCLPRLAQALLGARSEPHPVHRLDREARGLMLLAHDGPAAARLGELFRHGQIEKEYAVIVRGIPDSAELLAEQRLDGKECRSRFTVLDTDPATGTALLAARIEAGRRHQIRRHLAGLGFPVLGDPRYGHNNACALGLQLLARTLALTCPFTRKPRSWSLPMLPFPVPEPLGIARE
jgi:tRNA pseudouridine32 synthase/23S rRNA pseudouridine746 synthase